MIRETLDSVLAQDFAGQEVIVVDDGSTDETMKTLETYDGRIRVFQQKNSGPAVARNLGIQNAAGEYAAILDSDDLWFPWTLATYAEAIRRHGSPVFIAGAPLLFRDAAALRDAEPGPLRARFFEDYLASGDRWRWFGASSFVLRIDAVRAVGGFSDAWINSDDADLALRLGVARGFLHIQEPMTFGYREHEGSLKSDMEVSFRSLAYMISREESDGYPGGAGRRRERLEILTRHVRPFALACLECGALSPGWRLYCRTFAWHLSLRRAAFLWGYPVMAAINLLKNAMRRPVSR